MEFNSFMVTVIIGVAAFTSTNIDDIFILLLFFSDSSFKASKIVLGQFLGIGTLILASLIFSMIAKVVPGYFISLMGLFPLYIGIKKLLELRNGQHDEYLEESISGKKVDSQVLKVALVTMANGGDNISIYTPLFAKQSFSEVFLVAIIFFLMTSLWCLLGYQMVYHPVMGRPIRKYGRYILPWILIGLGFIILKDLFG